MIKFKFVSFFSIKFHINECLITHKKLKLSKNTYGNMYLYMYLHLQYIHLQENSIVSRRGKIFTTNGLMITAINCGATSVNDVCIGFLTPPIFFKFIFKRF